MPNLNSPAIQRGPVTERDLDALAASTREPGPQSSKAAPETWRNTDRAIYALLTGAVALIAVLGAIHIVAGAAG